MRALAWLLFCVGTGLAAAFGAKLRPDEVFTAASFFGASWWPFWAGVVLSTAGGLMLRAQIKAAAAGQGGGPTLTLADVRGRLERLAIDGRALAASIEAGDWDPQALKAGLDDILGTPLLAFTETSGVLAGQAGVAVFAEVMTRFAGAERKLNRAWSALVDEHPDEAAPQVVEAAGLLEDALAAFPQA
ncbi:MAG: hypothetical protein H6739_34425 [Alphaproteobacteria bacterium]|nr:hypothetical protein [Alphaproteobacteria bacterium]